MSHHPSKPTPNDLWFLNSLITIRIAGTQGQDGISVLEHQVAFGDSPPRHVHHTEDEVFQIIEGNFRFLLHSQELQAGAGAVLLVPKGAPHTYLAESPGGGRFLTITVRGDFEQFVREMSRPAERPELPEPTGPPPPEAMEHLIATAAKYGIEFVGPPLT